jgi:hypothetical protein
VFKQMDFRTKLSRSFLVFGMMLAGYTAVDLYFHASFQRWLLQVFGLAVGAFVVLVPVYYYERQDRLIEFESNKTAEELQALR